MSATSRRFLVGVVVVTCLLGIGPDALASTNWSVSLQTGSHGEATSVTLPAAPGGVVAECVSSSGKSIQVSWNAVPNATSYTVEESKTSAITGYAAVATGLTASPWTSGTLSNGTYWFEVVTVAYSQWSSAGSAASAETSINSSGNSCKQP